MQPDELETALESRDPVEVCRTLRFLAGPRSGPFYPQARVMGLLAPGHPDRVRENALVLVLRKGQHPLEDRRVLDLLVTASRQLFARLLTHITELAFPSAAEDTLSWCWDTRLHLTDRKAVLRGAEALGPRVAQRFIARHGILDLPGAVLVSAALGVLGRVGARESREVLERALEHPHPRHRSTALEHLVDCWSNPERRHRLSGFLEDPHHRIRSTAAVLAHQDDPTRSLQVLGEMIRARDPVTRAAAAWALGELKHREPRSLPLLRRLGQDGDHRVSSRARHSLLQMEHAAP